MTQNVARLKLIRTCIPIIYVTNDRMRENFSISCSELFDSIYLQENVDKKTWMYYRKYYVLS